MAESAQPSGRQGRSPAASIPWLPGCAGPADVETLLRGWPFLTHVRSLGAPARCARGYAADLARWAAPAAGGLVLAAGGGAADRWLAGVRRLDWDSRHYGFGVGRLEPLIAPVRPTIDEAVVRAGAEVVVRILAHAREAGLRHLSATADAADTTGQLCLQECGFRLADTIIGYQLVLEKVAPAAAPPGIRPGRPEDVEPLAAVAATAFGDRAYSVNRFNSDPALAGARACELYAAWLRNSFSGQQADEVLVAEEGGRPVGFITLRLSPPPAVCSELQYGEVPLNAILPGSQGRGIYTRLARAALEWFRARRAAVVEIRTQLTCGSVNHTWLKLGAYAALSHHTFHRDLDAPRGGPARP